MIKPSDPSLRPTRQQPLRKSARRSVDDTQAQSVNASRPVQPTTAQKSTPPGRRKSGSRFEDLRETANAIFHAFFAIIGFMLRTLFTGIWRLIMYIKNLLFSNMSRKKAILLLVLAVTGFFAWQRYSPNFDLPAAVSFDQRRGDQSPVGGTSPEYDTLLPSGVTIDSLGGWTRVSPPDRNPVFAYVDTIDGTRVTVSQQPLPDEFRDSDGEELATLAKAYSAERTISAEGTTVFIGASAKGPQSVIFTKQKLLILIKSSAPIDDEQWVLYISSLG